MTFSLTGPVVQRCVLNRYLDNKTTLNQYVMEYAMFIICDSNKKQII